MQQLNEQMTPALAEVVSEVEARRRAGTIISLFLDFDGTLVPIARDRATPRLDGAPRDTLRRISIKPSVVTTIISGRALDDLYSRVHIDGCIYAGNHGLEIFGPNLYFVEPVAAGLREELQRLGDTLNSQLCPIPGVSIEDKGLTISVHYRQAAEADVARVRDLVGETVSSTGSFRFRAGRKVLDIVPQTDWHKGIAAQWINRHLGAGKS